MNLFALISRDVLAEINCAVDRDRRRRAMDAHSLGENQREESRPAIPPSGFTEWRTVK